MPLEINQKSFRVLFNQLKSSAKKRKIPFDINFAEFCHISIPITCPILGVKLVFNTGAAKHNSVSFDRKDSTKGYSFDNIVVISNRANTLKSDATLDELQQLSEYYTNLKNEDDFILEQR